MKYYLLKRFGQVILTLLSLTVIVFCLVRISGNPVDTFLPIEATTEDRARIIEEWGLNQPLHVQYFQFIGNALRGEFGESWQWPGRKALPLVLDRIGKTLELGGLALIFSVAIAVPIGVVSAVYKDSRIDFVGKLIAILGQSLPHFWIGIIFMWVFAVKLKWLPSSGRGTILHLIMPVVVIGWFQVAALMRLVRSAMLESLDSQYVQLARIKGVSKRSLIWKHCFRNAIIPPLTYAGIMIGYLVIGSFTTEVVFSWPGVGQLVVYAVRARDFYVVQTVAIVFGVVIILVNFLVDILYAYFDPRIRYDKES